MRGATPSPGTPKQIRPTPKRFPFSGAPPTPKRNRETFWRRAGFKNVSPSALSDARRNVSRNSTDGETFPKNRLPAGTAKRFDPLFRDVETFESNWRDAETFPHGRDAETFRGPDARPGIPEKRFAVGPAAPTAAAQSETAKRFRVETFRRRGDPDAETFPFEARRNVSGPFPPNPAKRFAVIAAAPTPKRFHSRDGETFPRRRDYETFRRRATPKRFPPPSDAETFSDIRPTPKRFRKSAAFRNVFMAETPQRFSLGGGVKRFPVSPVADGRDGETFPDRFAP